MMRGELQYVFLRNVAITSHIPKCVIPASKARRESFFKKTGIIPDKPE